MLQKHAMHVPEAIDNARRSACIPRNPPSDGHISRQDEQLSNWGHIASGSILSQGFFKGAGGDGAFPHEPTWRWHAADGWVARHHHGGASLPSMFPSIQNRRLHSSWVKTTNVDAELSRGSECVPRFRPALRPGCYVRFRSSVKVFVRPLTSSSLSLPTPSSDTFLCLIKTIKLSRGLRPRELGALPRAKPPVRWSSGGNLIFSRCRAKLHVGGGNGQGQGPLQDPHRGEGISLDHFTRCCTAGEGRAKGGERGYGARGDKVGSQREVAAMLPRHAFVRGVAHHGPIGAEGHVAPQQALHFISLHCIIVLLQLHSTCLLVWCVAGDAADSSGGPFVESEEGNAPTCRRIRIGLP
jgi:hypothetical protein